MPKVLNFKVIVEQDERGYFVASVPAVPGCHTQGETYEEAIINIKDAIKLSLEVAKMDNSFKNKINWPEEKEQSSRFLGVTEVPVKFLCG